ncbi:site-specific DNA-methyltransferase [Enterobacter hormaechei]
MIKLWNCDCLNMLRSLPDESVDSIVTDPPYGISFMGKKWDYDVPSEEIWAECLRVLKPGGHLLSFSSARTYHRLAVRIEDAGFEIRDQAMWLYGSGFPKSQDIGKAIDKAAGAQREVTGSRVKSGDIKGGALHSGAEKAGAGHKTEVVYTAPATDAAKEWDGWGSALKPAHEPIVMARKPFKGTLALNVLNNRTGALNINACRVPFAGDADEQETKGKNAHATLGTTSARTVNTMNANTAERKDYDAPGRWPANVIHDGSECVVSLFPTSSTTGKRKQSDRVQQDAGATPFTRGKGAPEYTDAGSAARFFYCAKPSPAERHRGCVNPGPQFKHGATLRQVENTATEGNNHPTVKPIALMRHLVTLVTPPGGIVVDPFMGSGTTGIAATQGGFIFYGAEMDDGHFNIAHARIRYEVEHG